MLASSFFILFRVVHLKHPPACIILLHLTRQFILNDLAHHFCIPSVESRGWLLLLQGRSHLLLVGGHYPASKEKPGARWEQVFRSRTQKISASFPKQIAAVACLPFDIFYLLLHLYPLLHLSPFLLPLPPFLFFAFLLRSFAFLPSSG